MDKDSEDRLDMVRLMIGEKNANELFEIVTKLAVTYKIDTYKCRAFLVSTMYQIAMWLIRKQRENGVKLVWK